MYAAAANAYVASLPPASPAHPLVPFQYATRVELAGWSAGRRAAYFLNRAAHRRSVKAFGPTLGGVLVPVETAGSSGRFY